MLALLLTTQILIASGGPALQLTRSEDRLLSCPANALLEKAVRLRLPAVRVAPEGKPRAGDLIASLRRVGGSGWRFEVKRADGSVAMSRELMPMPCPQLADTCALILERFLSAIDWSGRDVGVAPLSPVERPTPQISPSEVTPFIPSEVTPFIPSEVEGPRGDRNTADAGRVALDGGGEPVSGPSTPLGVNGGNPPALDGGGEPSLGMNGGSPPALDGGGEPISGPSTPLGMNGGSPFALSGGPLDEPAVTGLTISLGGGAWGGILPELSPAFSAQLGARIVRRVHVSILFLGGASTTRTVGVPGEPPRGSLTVQSFAGLATLGLCTTGEGFSACGGLIGGARVTSASAAGGTTGPRLFDLSGKIAALPELGLSAKFSWPLYGRFSVGLDLAAAAPLGTAKFSIEGFEATDYATPFVDLTGVLYVGFRLF